MTAKFKILENIPDNIKKKLDETGDDYPNYLIEDLIKLRQKTWDKYEESFDKEKCDYTEKTPPEIDELAAIIRQYIEENFWNLEVDFILETWTKLGDAPCILYNDNGYFACYGSNFQSIDTGEDEPDKMEMSFWIPSRYWKKTIKEAMYYYMTEDGEDESDS